MKNILIIKTNASGDVLRTTVLLHFLEGNIFWVTSHYNFALFPAEHPNLTLVPVEAIPQEISTIAFDIVINLEEDLSLAKWVDENIKAEKITGIFHDRGIVNYSCDSSEWFDMSLASKLSRVEANRLKIGNRLSYQEIVCRMVGHRFAGQPYKIYHEKGFEKQTTLKIGIERRVGNRWPNKYWQGYERLEKFLLEDQHELFIFNDRPQLRDYLNDIRQCSLIVTGDTLAMHIALAYGIPCIAIFNCTSPYEIYDYGILKKVVSPRLVDFFYDTREIPAAMEAVSVENVLEAIHQHLHVLSAG